jgi:phosphoglycolate phosphatase-like HAD superfamily hydrolase
MVRLVLFDIDGTLIRTGGAGMKAFAKVFETEFHAVDGLERLKFAGRTDVSLVREFFSLHKIVPTPENFQRFFDPYVFWLEQFLDQSDGGICPGVEEFLDELDSLPQPPLVGLLTGNIRLGAEIKLRHFRLWSRFATGAFADDHEDRDQIASIARDRGTRLLKEDLRPDQVLVVGDTPFDIRCGRAIGARILAVATGGCSFEELRQHQPDWIVETLAGLSTGEVVGKGAGTLRRQVLKTSKR